MERRARRTLTGLALVSLGLGSAEFAVPGPVARLVGADDHPGNRAVMRWACGARELAAAYGVGFSRRPSRWLWARVAGDALDLALLGSVLARYPQRRGRTLAAATAVLGVTAADVATARRVSRHPQRYRSDVFDMRASITVNRPLPKVFAFWHDFENLPRFMAHLDEVSSIGGGKWRWTANARTGVELTWEAEVTTDVVEELIAWSSVEGADLPHTGSVRFNAVPGGRGTEVHVQLHYRPPAGRLGAAFATLLGADPNQQLRDDLRRFKQLLETGEVLRSEASPQGPSSRRLLKQRPAQPLEDLSGG